MLLERERDELTRLERELSYLYAEVLLAHTSKSVYKDQFFFETLIYLVSRVIKEFFTREEFVVVEEGKEHHSQRSIVYSEQIGIT